MNRMKSYIALATLFTTACLSAQTVPVPSQLKTAQTAFVVNAGGPSYSLNRDAYVDFYQALASSKRFQLTTVPSAAELSLELSIDSSLHGVSSGLSYSTTTLRLNIRDIKTQNLLWSITEPLSTNSWEAVSSKNLLTASSALVSELNTLSLSSSMYANQSAPTKSRMSQEKQ